jgi:hypothetical protein
VSFDLAVLFRAFFSVALFLGGNVSSDGFIQYISRVILV